MNDFEKRLSQVPMKSAPADWRTEILAAAERAAATVKGQRAQPAFSAWLQNLLWPHPRAWAGLAAVWLLILLVNLSHREEAPALVEKSAPPSPAVMAELRQERQMLGELLGNPDTAQPRSATPQPHALTVQMMKG